MAKAPYSPDTQTKTEPSNQVENTTSDPSTWETDEIPIHLYLESDTVPDLEDDMETNHSRPNIVVSETQGEPGTYKTTNNQNTFTNINNSTTQSIPTPSISSSVASELERYSLPSELPVYINNPTRNSPENKAYAPSEQS